MPAFEQCWHTSSETFCKIVRNQHKAKRKPLKYMSGQSLIYSLSVIKRIKLNLWLSCFLKISIKEKISNMKRYYNTSRFSLNFSCK